MHLLIDAGNTRIKFTLAAGEKLVTVFHCDFKTASGQALKEQAATLETENLDAIWLASTLGPQKTATLHSNLTQLWPDVAVKIISNNSQGDLIQHCYAEPEKLGIDRLLAMIGVQTKYQTPALIFDMGTVITADLLMNKQHIGGWLTPGLATLKASLLDIDNIVAGTNQSASEALSSPFGNSTIRCVESGCHATVVGFLEQAILKSRQTFAEPYTIYITGGDAEQFANILSMPTLHLPNLVFEGMQYLTRQHSPSNMETV